MNEFNVWGTEVSTRNGKSSVHESSQFHIRWVYVYKKLGYIGSLLGI